MARPIRRVKPSARLQFPRFVASIREQCGLNISQFERQHDLPRGYQSKVECGDIMEPNDRYMALISQISSRSVIDLWNLCNLRRGEDINIGLVDISPILRKICQVIGDGQLLRTDLHELLLFVQNQGLDPMLVDEVFLRAFFEGCAQKRRIITSKNNLEQKPQI